MFHDTLTEHPKPPTPFVRCRGFAYLRPEHAGYPLGPSVGAATEYPGYLSGYPLRASGAVGTEYHLRASGAVRTEYPLGAVGGRR